MVSALEKEAQETSKRPSLDSTAFLSDTGLEQFVSHKSKTLLNRLNLPDDWLNKDPTHWPQLESYEKAQSSVSSLHVAVTNDRAERGVALIEAYNRKLTTNEEQLQFLLHVVSEHKRRFPDPRKATVLANAGQYKK